MNNWTFKKIYRYFLAFVQSCTFADLLDDELEEELYKFLTRALADFRFPQVDLEYSEILNERDEVIDYLLDVLEEEHMGSRGTCSEEILIQCGLQY